MKRMKLKTSTARLTSAGLLLILAVSSFLLSGAVSSLNSPVAIGPGRRFIDLGGNYTEVGSGGRIVVKTQGSFGGFAGGFSGVLPLSGVNISIRGATSPALAALTFHTNSTVIVKVQPAVFTYLYLPQETRLSLPGLDQRGSVVWLTLRPMESIKISDGMGLGVALYKPSYGAFTYAA